MARPTKKDLDAIAPVVQRPKSNKGRKALDKPELEAFAEAFAKLLKSGDTRLVPGTEGMTEHSDLTLARYHLKRIFAKHGIDKDQYETFAHPDGLGIEKL